MNILSNIIAASALFLTLSCAQAATLVLDTYIGHADIGSSKEANEKEVLAAAIAQWESTGTLYDNNSGAWESTGIDTTEFTKVDTAGDEYDSTTGYNYLTVSDEPSYFVLKFGAGQNDYDLFFFKNEISYNQLVWDNDFLFDALCAENSTSTCDQNAKVQGLSHYLYSGDVSAVPAVPIPAAAWLFGSAFLGLMGVARKRTKVA